MFLQVALLRWFACARAGRVLDARGVADDASLDAFFRKLACGITDVFATSSWRRYGPSGRPVAHGPSTLSGVPMRHSVGLRVRHTRIPHGTSLRNAP